MKIADEISYENSCRSHTSKIRTTNSYENYMRSHMRSHIIFSRGMVMNSISQNFKLISHCLMT